MGSDGFWVGTARSYEVELHDPAGGLRRVVRWTGPDRTVTEDLVEAFIRGRLEGREGEERRELRRELEEWPVAEERRAYEELVAAETGHLWVRDFERPGSAGPYRWTVFDSTGRLSARAETPRRIRVYEIGPDYVLGHWRDELGVERIRLYELEREGEP